ncbi:MAG: CHASE3 domain-containing protein [Magnetococcales bacterium]|nr:CHASE3 domain-containing protein [Magnetococcales bacterium]
MGFNTKLILGGALIFLVVLLNGVLMYNTVRSLLSTQQWVDHTWQVIGRGEKLTKMLVDMETGARGFLIVGKESFLAPYYSTTENLDKEIHALRALVSDDVEQVKRLNKVERLAHDWRENVGSVLIEQRRKVTSGAVNAETLQNLVKARTGKAIFDRMRDRIAALGSALQRKKIGKDSELLLLSLSKDMVDQETGQRGFLITGDQLFLEPFEHGQIAFQSHFDQLMGLIKAHPELVTLLNEVGVFAKEWLDKTGRPEIMVRELMREKSDSMARIVTMVEQEGGKQKMDALRKVLGDFIQHERKLIVQRQKASQLQTGRAVLMALVGNLIVIVLGTFVISIIVRSINRPLKAITRQMERLGKGEFVREEVNYQARDLLGRMLSASHQVLDNMARLNHQVDAISRGDYSQQVAVLSDKDTLGRSINQMTSALDENRVLNQQQNWISTGLRSLSHELSGNPEVVSLADRSLSFLTRYLEAGQGIFYAILDEKKQGGLTLTATCMVPEPDKKQKYIMPGEGAVGQVLREKAAIRLTNIPRQDLAITTGLIADAPLNTYTFPLIYEETVYGVVELASFNQFEENHKAFLNEAADLIAAGLFAALQQEKIRLLLAHAEAKDKGLVS